MFILVSVLSLMAIQYPSTIKDNTQKNLNSVKDQKNDKIFVWLVFLCIAFVAMFRYGVGTDFFSYYNGHNWINKFKKGDYSEPGFTLFSIVCSVLFGNINGAITIGAALVTVFLFIFTINKRAENFPLSIILFILTGVFTGMFNGVRQYLATAVLFAGHHFIIDKKPIKWLFVVLLASSFHVTAILMFFIYFVCNLKCNWTLVFMYLGMAIVLLFAYESLFNLVGALKQDEIDTNDAYMSSGVNKLRVVVQCVPILLLFFLNKDKINKDGEARFLLNICLLNAAIAVAAMNSPYLSRFWIYTSCFQVLMYPKIFNKMRRDDRDLFVVLLLFFYSLFWVYEILNAPSLRNFYWIFNYL
jgi:hypothetical protein